MGRLLQHRNVIEFKDRQETSDSILSLLFSKYYGPPSFDITMLFIQNELDLNMTKKLVAPSHNFL